MWLRLSYSVSIAGRLNRSPCDECKYVGMQVVVAGLIRWILPAQTQYYGFCATGVVFTLSICFPKKMSVSSNMDTTMKFTMI